MYSYGPPHMAVQKQDDQHEHTSRSYVRIRDVVLRTCQGRWTIGRSGERGSGISVLPARDDDDDDDIKKRSKTNELTRILMSSKTLMSAWEITLYCESYKGKKVVAGVRAGIKLWGPVGLERVNKG